ncbi:Death-on-curing protein [Hyella patelloides LEGE 07179]|uniref:Death-on-curing protein n=1 Tax=Hyella patelloides LEGE 07179 TaxID=945734 RepID=A0A563VWT7_9CYAN|nr:type II toxin-antitoxin system death-on-curing family toxin [Hyella patelloides]VEP15890.1 Death-on-curing protein [Hyella patelloides LEGE 07179]
MAEPKWIDESIVIYIHDDQIAQHGGSYGILNRGLLASVLTRSRNLYEYEGENNFSKLAASYGYGLAKNHSFVDGNKRTAFQVMFVFLRINSLYLDAPESEVVVMMQQLAEGEITQENLAKWLE